MFQQLKKNKKMKKRNFVLLLVLFISSSYFVKAQQITTFGTLYQGDTIPFSFLEPIKVVGYMCPLSNDEKRQYSKLIRDVKKTYPYAKQAGQLLNSYYGLLKNAQNDSQRDKIKKQAAKDIDNKFYPQIKKLNKDQGKVLSKLIYRQTGASSYYLLKDFAGSFRAAFYNTASKAMGVNLNEDYDPQNDSQDRMIERIISGINQNKL